MLTPFRSPHASLANQKQPAILSTSFCTRDAGQCFIDKKKGVALLLEHLELFKYIQKLATVRFVSLFSSVRFLPVPCLMSVAFSSPLLFIVTYRVETSLKQIT